MGVNATVLAETSQSANEERIRPQCNECVFSTKHDTDITGRSRICRRHPPQVFFLSQTPHGPSTITAWPIVPANAWCGDFEPEDLH